MVLRQTFLLLMLWAVPTQAQSIDVTAATGRVFNYPAGQWMFGTALGTEIAWRKAFASVSWSFSQGRYFERDITVGLQHEMRRLTLTSDVSYYAYPGFVGDITWSVNAKYSLKR